ncbi:hypothetical protein Tco_1574969 [Tanacetum coccineum]
MADLPPPDHAANLLEDESVQPEPTPVILHHAPAQPDGYVVDDDMEDDEEEDSEEDPEKEQIEQDYDEELEENEVDEDDDEELEEDGVGDGKEEEMEIDDEMDNSKVINPDETKEGELPPHIPANPKPEAEAATVGTGRLVPLTGHKLFTNTQVHRGSSSFAAIGYTPEDLTPSHIRSDLNALHRRVRQIDPDDVRAKKNRLRMMLDCSENFIRTTHGELDRATWYYRQLRHWSLEVQRYLPPHMHYQVAPYVPNNAPVVPIAHNDPRDLYVAARDDASVPATDDNDIAAHEETSPSEPQGFPPRDS